MKKRGYLAGNKKAIRRDDRRFDSVHRQLATDVRRVGNDVMHRHGWTEDDAFM